MAKRRPAKFRIPPTGCTEELAPKELFEPKSFRWVKSGRGRILVGCPKGQWAPRTKGRVKGRAVIGVCKVGTRAHMKVTPREGRKHCPAGQKRRGTY